MIEFLSRSQPKRRQPDASCARQPSSTARRCCIETSSGRSRGLTIPARSVVRDLLRDPDETVRQAAIHVVGLWRDRDAMSPLVELLSRLRLKIAGPRPRHWAESATNRRCPHSCRPQDEPTIASSNIRSRMHLSKSPIPTGTEAGLSSENPRTLKAAMVALDQMEGGSLAPNLSRRCWPAGARAQRHGGLDHRPAS